jgi:large subunit ribosomal protein L10
MNPQEKAAVVDSLKKEIEQAKSLILMKYQGIDVEAITKLRRTLDKEDATFRVIKNTLFKRAIKGTSLECLAKYFEGPVAVAYAWKNPASLAKTILDALKENEALGIKAGFISGKEIGMEDIRILGSLPPIEVLRAKFLSVLNGPASKFLMLLNTASGNFLGVLNAREKELEKEN